MLRDRPPPLLEIPHYQYLPGTAVSVLVDQLPPLLNMDIQFELRGVLPLTQEISDLWPQGIDVNPNQDVIDYYLTRKTLFQLVSVVVNCAYFEPFEDIHVGLPYSVRLFPGTKRQEIDQQDIRSVAFLDLEELPQSDNVYSGFDPFEGTWEWFAPYRFIAEKPDIPVFSDTIGFIVSQYFLATDCSSDDALMTGPVDATPDLWQRFHRFRSKRYYTPFTDMKPRAIWGAESPIELYLFQALLHRGLRPMLQVRIYSDGSIYPSYHDMFQNEIFKTDNELATTPDLYFPTQKVAVYCDSVRHHRGEKAKKKDEEISERVRAMGITPVRVNGRTIVHNIEKAVSAVVAYL